MKTATFIALLSAITTFTVSPIIYADSTSGAADKVEVETVEVESTDSTAAPATDSASKEKAGQLWEKTRKETGEAASAAADYSKTQGSRAVEGTKKGVAKGTEAVTKASKKAWSATKETTDKVLDSTGKALKKTGEALEGALD